MELDGPGQAAVDQVRPVLDLLQLALDDAGQAVHVGGGEVGHGPLEQRPDAKLVKQVRAVPGPVARNSGDADVEQPADRRLDPAQRPPLVMSEPVRQRPFSQLGLQPCPLLRAQPLSRHRPFGPRRLVTAVALGPVPPPHRTRRDPQVICDLVDLTVGGEPPGGLQPQPLMPLLLAGRVPAPLRIPHASVIRPQSADVTTQSLRVHPG